MALQTDVQVGLPFYATLASLQAETDVPPLNQVVAVGSPPQFYQATQTVALGVPTSTGNAYLANVNPGTTTPVTTYWLPIGSNAASRLYKLDAVALSIGANTVAGGVLTVTASGALTAAQFDGVTPAVGTKVLFMPGLTNITNATTSGPWQVLSLGSATTSATFVRPPEWQNGQTGQQGTAFTVLGGNIYANTVWVATAAAAVIGTTDNAFYCRSITFQAKLGGTATAKQTLSANQPVAIASYPLTGGTATASPCPVGLMPLPGAGVAPAQGPQVLCSLALLNGTNTGTVNYGILAEPTAGYVGTATFSVNAIATAYAINTNADTSTLNVTVTNPC